jgi:ribosomal protein S10
MDTKPDGKAKRWEDYEQEIYKQTIVINFIKSIEEKIGKEETKKIFIDIINNL